MKHPFQLLSAKISRNLFLVLLLATLVIMYLLNLVSAPLTTQVAPMGIISYEFAGSVEKARQVLASWDAPTQIRAGFALGFDYVYLLFYSTTIGLACILAAGALRDRRWPLASAGVLLAWGLWGAAVFDAIENLALTLLLFGNLTSPLPALALVCAAIKFGLIFLGLVYALYGAVIRLVFPGPELRTD